MTDEQILEQVLDAEDKVNEPNVMDENNVLVLEEIRSSVSVGKRVRMIQKYNYGSRVVHQGFYLVVGDI